MPEAHLRQLLAATTGSSSIVRKEVPSKAPTYTHIDGPTLKALASHEIVYISGETTLRAIRFAPGGVEYRKLIEMEHPRIVASPQDSRLRVLSKGRIWELVPDGDRIRAKEVMNLGEHALNAAIHAESGRIAWEQLIPRREGFISPEEKPDVMVGTFGGNKWTNFGSGQDPYWTDDGQQVVCSGFNQGWFVAMIDVNTKRVKRLDVPFYNPNHMRPCPSHDSKMILFTMRGGDGTQQLGKVSQSGEVVPWTNEGMFNSMPVFSPDGQHVVFIRNSSLPHDLVLRNVATGQEVLLATDASQYRPYWRKPEASADTRIGEGTPSSPSLPVKDRATQDRSRATQNKTKGK
jgi:hypothetical protein